MTVARDFWEEDGTEGRGEQPSQKNDTKEKKHEEEAASLR